MGTLPPENRGSRPGGREGVRPWMLYPSRATRSVVGFNPARRTYKQSLFNEIFVLVA
jgi:hypothetical protein